MLVQFNLNMQTVKLYQFFTQTVITIIIKNVQFNSFQRLWTQQFEMTNRKYKVQNCFFKMVTRKEKSASTFTELPFLYQQSMIQLQNVYTLNEDRAAAKRNEARGQEILQVKAERKLQKYEGITDKKRET